MAPLVRLLVLPCLGVFLVLLCLATQLLLDVLQIPLDLQANRGAGQVLFYLLMLGGVFLFVRFIWNQHVMISLARTYANPANRLRVVRGFLIGAGTAVTAGVATYCVFLRFGAAVVHPNGLAQLNFNRITDAFLVLLIIPIMVATEELIFRVFIYNYLRGDAGRSSKTSAILVANLGSAFIFAFSHGFREPLSWLEPDNAMLFVGLFLLGILLALAYEFSGSLTVNMGLHTGFLWTKVPRRCEVILLHQKSHWWAGVADDPRTAPFVWGLFVVVMIGVYAFRRRLFRIAAVESNETATNFATARATLLRPRLSA